MFLEWKSSQVHLDYRLGFDNFSKLLQNFLILRLQFTFETKQNVLLPDLF